MLSTGTPSERQRLDAIASVALVQRLGDAFGGIAKGRDAHPCITDIPAGTGPIASVQAILCASWQIRRPSSTNQKWPYPEFPRDAFHSQQVPGVIAIFDQNASAVSAFISLGPAPSCAACRASCPTPLMILRGVRKKPRNGRTKAHRQK